MFIDPKDIMIPTEQVRRDLAILCAQKNPGQFVMSSNKKIACFRQKAFIVCDVNFAPLLIYTETAQILFCAISDSGRFAVFQSQDSATRKTAFTVLDLLRKRVVEKSDYKFEAGVTHLFVDERRCSYTVYRGNTKETFLFEFRKREELSAESISRQLGISPERLRQMEQKARESMGDKWEKELDAQNKAKAGIE